MLHFNKKIFLLLLIQLVSSSLYAQLLLHDDFGSKKNDWYWRSDGNQSIPVIEDGLLHLHLKGAVDSEYCNTEIYNTTEHYLAGTQVRVRLKTTNIHKGSRGWGFWDGDLDISSLVYDYDVAWVMQQGSDRTGSDYNWFLFGSDGDELRNRQIFNLDNEVEETDWNTYKIIWESEKVQFFINEEIKYETNQYLPDQEMRMDIWIDNRVINLTNPLEQWHNNVESSEMFVDFVEVSNSNGPSIKREIKSDIVLWKSPNSFPNGNKETIWKNYNFTTSSSGEALVFLTGNAESYSTVMDDDDLRIVIDNKDFGWDSQNSFNGDVQNGKYKSLILPLTLANGDHNFKLYSDNTPYLRDAIVVFSENKVVTFSKAYNEVAKNDGLWKTIEFSTNISEEVSLIISGVADANEGIRFELDNENFGWNGDNAIDGDELKGLPNTVVLSKNLESGTHRLKIYSKGEPKLLSLAIYGNSSITDLENTEETSNNFTLSANPNPFNISTNIFYRTSVSSHNTVSIFNVLGQKVATLVNEFQQNGEHRLVWNANSETSGIYFCIFESNNQHKVEKLLLLK